MRVILCETDLPSIKEQSSVMCIVFWSVLRDHPKFKFVLADNRDEYLARETRPLHVWEPCDEEEENSTNAKDSFPMVIGSQDMAAEEQGTWLAAGSNGRVAVLTNYRDFRDDDVRLMFRRTVLTVTAACFGLVLSLLRGSTTANPIYTSIACGMVAWVVLTRRDNRGRSKTLSRGVLVPDFVRSHAASEEFVDILEQNHNRYGPFNLLTIDEGLNVNYFNNRTLKREKVGDGVHGLSNGELDQWDKVDRGKTTFSKLLQHHDLDANQMADLLISDLLSDGTESEDHLVQDTGGLKRLEKWYSSINVPPRAQVFPPLNTFGTRTKSVVIVDKENRITYTETDLDVKSGVWQTRRFQQKTANGEFVAL